MTWDGRGNPGATEFKRRLHSAIQVMQEALELVEWGAYDKCDCGHRRCEHRRYVPPGGERVYDACERDSCLCLDFDDSGVVVDEWQAMRDLLEENPFPPEGAVA